MVQGKLLLVLGRAKCLSSLLDFELLELSQEILLIP
jgi:hypothetical protein